MSSLLFGLSKRSLVTECYILLWNYAYFKFEYIIFMYYIYGYLFQSFRQVQIYGEDWSQQTEKEASVLTTTVLGKPRLKSLMVLWIWTDATFFVSECKIRKYFHYLY